MNDSDWYEAIKMGVSPGIILDCTRGQGERNSKWNPFTFNSLPDVKTSHPGNVVGHYYTREYLKERTFWLKISENEFQRHYNEELKVLSVTPDKVEKADKAPAVELKGTGWDKNPMSGRTLKVKKLTAEAKLPRRTRPTDAGYDLFYTGEAPVTVPRGGHAIVPTGVAVEIPPGHVGLVRDRSGLASTQGLTVLGGVIDESYRGELLVVLHQTPGEQEEKFIHSGNPSLMVGGLFVNQPKSTDPYQVNKGDRIAQLVVVPCFQGPVEEVEDLTPTDRGDKGFGSSGK